MSNTLLTNYKYLLYNKIMIDKKAKFLKIFLLSNIFLLLTGSGIIAHRLLFNEIEIKMEEINFVEEFKIEVAEVKLKERPGILIISPDKATIEGKKLQIEKQGTQIGTLTNSQILIPLRVKSNIKRDKNLFFIPQFRARIKGTEEIKLKANFSLYLKTDNCPKNREKIELENKGLVLCQVNIRSSNVGSFTLTERRKNILTDEIIALTNKNNYLLALKITPDLEILKNLSSFSIIIENITPELIIGSGI